MIRSKRYSKQIFIQCVLAYVTVSLTLGAFLNCTEAAESDADDRLEKLESAVAALQQENKEMKQENKALKQQVAALAGGEAEQNPKRTRKPKPKKIHSPPAA